MALFGLLGGGGKAPKAPDLIPLAKEQAKNDLALARYGTQANRINEFTPFGNRTFTNKGDTWTSRQALSPAEKRIYDAQSAGAISSGRLGNTMIGRARAEASRPMNLNSLPARPIDAGQTAQDALMARLEPQFARDEESLRSRLINQGLTPGSEAANTEMTLFNQDRTDARLQAGLQSMNFGEQARTNAFGEQSYLRNEPINMANALRSGVQLNQPNYTQPGQQGQVQGPDLTGATMGNFQNQLGAYNAKQQGSANTMNGLVGLASAGAVAY